MKFSNFTRMRSVRKQAESVSRNESNAIEFLDRTFRKAIRHKTVLYSIWKDLMTLFHLLKSYFRKEYQEISWEKILLAVIGIVYLANPMDAIPDFIPFKGLLDDAAVLNLTLAMLRPEINNFQEWKKSQHSPQPVSDTLSTTSEPVKPQERDQQIVA